MLCLYRNYGAPWAAKMRDLTADELVFFDQNPDFEAGLVGVSGSQFHRLRTYLNVNGGLRVRPVREELYCILKQTEKGGGSVLHVCLPLVGVTVLESGFSSGGCLKCLDVLLTGDREGELLLCCGAEGDVSASIVHQHIDETAGGDFHGQAS